MDRFLVCLIMLESYAAGIAYFTKGDWRRGIYWTCGATIALTFL